MKFTYQVDKQSFTKEIDLKEVHNQVLEVTDFSILEKEDGLLNVQIKINSEVIYDETLKKEDFFELAKENGIVSLEFTDSPISKNDYTIILRNSAMCSLDVEGNSVVSFIKVERLTDYNYVNTVVFDIPKIFNN